MPKKDLVRRIDMQGNAGTIGGFGGLPYSSPLNRYLEPWLHIFDARTLQLLSEIFGGRKDGPKVNIRWQTEEPQQGEISAVDVENVPFFSVFVTDYPDAQVGLIIGYRDRPGIRIGWKLGDTNARPQVLVDAECLTNEIAMRAVAGNTTLDMTYATVKVTAACTITLPAAADYTMHPFTIIHDIGAGGTVAIAPTGAETIAGEPTQSLASRYDAIRVESDGSNWLTV